MRGQAQDNAWAAQDLPLQSFFQMGLPKYPIKTHLTAHFH